MNLFDEPPGLGYNILAGAASAAAAAGREGMGARKRSRWASQQTPDPFSNKSSSKQGDDKDDDGLSDATLLANKARMRPIGMVVFFFGALMSATCECRLSHVGVTCQLHVTYVGHTHVSTLAIAVLPLSSRADLAFCA